MFQYAPVDKTFIFSRISEEDIFHKYLGIFPNTEDYFTNPMRDDTHADCKFYRNSAGVLKFKDFAGGINWDCFNVVEAVEADVHNFYDAMRRVARDFNLYEEKVNYEVVADFQRKMQLKRKSASIKVKRRSWDKSDLEWWSNEQIKSRDVLDQFHVACVDVAWLNDNIIYRYSKNDPCYVFWFGEYDYKLYFPLRKTGRFLQTKGDILQGYLQLPEGGDILILTKSYKDVICMSTFGIYAVAPMSEANLITVEQFEELSNRFFKIFSLMDRDRTGMRMAQMLRKTYDVEPLLFETENNYFKRKEEPKDFTEITKAYGTNYMLDLIEETKQILAI